MLKWAVLQKDERPINPTQVKSLKKRRKDGDMQRDGQGGLISGCSKHRNVSQGPASRGVPHNKRVRVGVISNNNLNNESDNGKVNGHNYKVPDKRQEERLVPPLDKASNTNTIPHSMPITKASQLHNNNNNIINSDSKSMLYMSLDHLPMAIVKQYERMLQDAPLKSSPKSVLKPQQSTNCANNNGNNHQSRPPNSKTKNQKHASPPTKKSHSKSITFKDDGNESNFRRTNTEKVVQQLPSPVQPLSFKSSEISIKEAHNRPLKVLSSKIISRTPSPKGKASAQKRFNKTPSPELVNEKYPHNSVYTRKHPKDDEEEEEERPELPAKKSAFICDKPQIQSVSNATSISHPANPLEPNPSLIYSKPNANVKVSETKKLSRIPENEENDPPKKTGQTTTSNIIIKGNEGIRMPSYPHDTTDPQFLEKPITYSTAPVAKCAKKLTLKRSELKKLERLSNKAERLNRFLKKYYHDCLPNLPEEEDSQCSPEEKSVRLSILRTHWREVKPSSQNPHHLVHEGSGESDEDSSSSTHSYENVHSSHHRPRFPYSNPKVNNKFSPLHLSSSSPSYSNLPELSVDDYAVTWENLLNASIPFPSSETSSRLLPIIQEDSGEMSSSTANSESRFHTREKEVVRDAATANMLGMDESFLMSRTRIQTDDSLVHLTKQSLGFEEVTPQREKMSDNFHAELRISYDDGEDGEEDDEERGGGEGGGIGMKKLKGLLGEPLGELFDPPASLAEDEGFMSPCPPEAYSPASSSTSTFNRFSVSSSSGKGSTREDGDEHESEDFKDDYDKGESNLGRTSSQGSSSSSEALLDADGEILEREGGPKYIIMELKHENPNYLPARSVDERDEHNETWNSHGFVPASPCGTISSLHSHPSSSAITTGNSSPIPGAVEENGDETSAFNLMRNKRENEEEEESFVCNRLALAFSTPKMPKKKGKSLPQTSLRLIRAKKSTPRKVVRKPPVNSALSGKGELLIRTYKNDGNYITVHVLQARRLEAQTLSSWKLSIRVSLLPEAETTFTRSCETVLVGRNRTWTKIDQKFSFETSPDFCSDTKVFLTAIKRVGKKSSFLGWISLTLSEDETTQSWVKFRKRRMNTATYKAQVISNYGTTGPQANNNNSSKGLPSGELGRREVEPMDSPSPQPGQMDNGSSSSSRCDCDMAEHMPKSQLQNSSTMDSGVEDCCEPPPPPAPSIDLDDKNGQRVNVKMRKLDGEGYGFSVVWLQPPRIERLEKGKAAEVGGLRIGDLIIGVNGEDVTSVPNTTIYTKMKTTGNDLTIEIWRTNPPIQSRSTSRHQQSVADPEPTPLPPIAKPIPSVLAGATSSGNESVTSRPNRNINEPRHVPESQSQPKPSQPISQPQPAKPSSKTNVNANINHVPCHKVAQNSVPPQTRPRQCQPPPPSILKPPPPAPPVSQHSHQNANLSSQQQPQPGSSSWRIRFNIELLDNEDDCLKQFFICELKFFRKVVAALDRYLIPVQSNHLLTQQEIHLMFSQVIKVITVTKRILNCVSNGSSTPGWKFKNVLLSTHSDHLSEMVSAYTGYAKSLGVSATILSDKMSLQEFARFVLETPVPKGHLDITSLLFSPLEHLRNICEICEEVSRGSEEWVEFFNHLKECYANIICETDYMEPISHVSMKKHPLLSGRDLEKRVVSTSGQPVKVCEKGRRWLFGSRLFKKESDGSWTPVWAFLFQDIIVLTSHTTRDRVFFVKEPPIRLEDVVTVHFNLPRKHENEFRLLFGPEPQQSRFDKIFPLHRSKKPHQVCLKTKDKELKSIWKLLLQKQIITLNTRLSKSASSNFSISEFCERFPITPCEEDNDDGPPHKNSSKGLTVPSRSEEGRQLQAQGPGGMTVSQKPPPKPERANLAVIKEEKSSPLSKPIPYKPYAPDGLSSLSKEMLKSKVARVVPERKGNKGEGIHEEIKVTGKPPNDPDETTFQHSGVQPSTKTVLNMSSTTTRMDETTAQSFHRKPPGDGVNGADDFVRSYQNSNSPQMPKTIQSATSYTPSRSSSSSITNNNNNEVADFNKQTTLSETCPCVVVQEKVGGHRGNGFEPFVKSVSGQGNINVLHERASFVNTSPNYPSVPVTGTDATRRDSKERETQLKKTSESPKNESPYHRPGAEDRIQRTVLSTSTPSPSISNNRVEALRHESVGMLKPNNANKPGPRIMTNATLKSRQQELLAQKEGETIITMVEPSPNSANGADCILISQHIEPTDIMGVTKDAPSSPLIPPRCQSANGFVKSRPVHTDSPLLTGYGSEKPRRRVLYDYKVQKDYPELFGISPQDRRSFIKRFETPPEKSLVAPYYFSPLPTPKFPKRHEPNGYDSPQKDKSGSQGTWGGSSSSTPTMAKKSHSNGGFKNEVLLEPKLLKELKGKLVERDLSKNGKEKGGKDEDLEAIARGLLRNAQFEETDEESDDTDECQDVEVEVHRQRSPEESSNDSGISDEVTEKSKKENERFQSNVEVNSSEVKFSSKISNTIVTHSEKQILPKSPHACIPTRNPSQSTKIPLSVFEGQEETMETIVVLKADKGTITEGIFTDDMKRTQDDTTHPQGPQPFDSHPHLYQPDKPMRILMMERRQAFFNSNQASSNFRTASVPSPHHRPSFQSDSPERAKVKIIDGGTLHTTTPDKKPVLTNTSPPSERVQLTRFPEKERNARVERVESSDDSTSSDIASASPAAENGTTDPSWSSSSSSLAGYNSSKEEPTTSMSSSGATSIYNRRIDNYSRQYATNGYGQAASASKVFMSDFTNGLPNSSSLSTNASLFLSSNSSCPNGPEIVITQESPETPTVHNLSCNSEGEEDTVLVCNGTNPHGSDLYGESGGGKKSFLRVESNDSTAENFGDDDDYIDEEDDSHCSVMNRYGTYEDLDKIENEEDPGELPDFTRTIPRSKARFTFDDDSDDDDANDLYEEEFESDFNFKFNFPSQIPDNTYSVSTLGALPPVLEEDEDDFDDQATTSSTSPGPGTSSGIGNGGTLKNRQQVGLSHDHVLSRLVSMYGTSISPLRILRDLLLKKRYRQSSQSPNWKYKE